MKDIEEVKKILALNTTEAWYADNANRVAIQICQLFEQQTDEVARELFKEIESKLIEAKTKLSNKRETEEAQRPMDSQTYISIGGRLKGLQQAIDIIQALKARYIEKG